MEELLGCFSVTRAILPKKAVSASEIVGAKPVDACREPWRSAEYPIALPGGRPGIADFHLLVNVDFIDIEHHDFALTHPCVKLLKLLDKLVALRRIGFGQQLLALFPTETCGFE